MNDRTSSSERQSQADATARFAAAMRIVGLLLLASAGLFWLVFAVRPTRDAGLREILVTGMAIGGFSTLLVHHLLAHALVRLRRKHLQRALAPDQQA